MLPPLAAGVRGFGPRRREAGPSEWTRARLAGLGAGRVVLALDWATQGGERGGGEGRSRWRRGRVPRPEGRGPTTQG